MLCLIKNTEAPFKVGSLRFQFQRDRSDFMILLKALSRPLFAQQFIHEIEHGPDVRKDFVIDAAGQEAEIFAMWRRGS